MARRFTLTLALVAVALLVTSMGVPALLENVPTAPLAQTRAAGAPSTLGLPANAESPPSSASYGLYVSGLAPGAAPLFGPEPLATAQTRHGFGEERAIGGELLVFSPDGLHTLARVKTVNDYAAARTVVGPDKTNHTRYWSAQARATSYVAYATLLDGQITARLLDSRVFASANQRTNDSFRLEAGDSRVAELFVFNQLVKVDQKLVLPLLGLGTLYVNQTVLDPVAGTVTNYALHLQLNNGMDIVVSAATAHVGREPLGPDSLCMTYSEAYPVGDKGRLEGDELDARHNLVMGDPPIGFSHVHGEVNDVPLGGLDAVLTASAAGAENDDTTRVEGAYSTSTGVVTHVNLLNGLVTADVVRGSAASSVNISGPTPVLTTSAAGSVLLGATVSGTSLGTTPQPNTEQVVLLNGKKVADLWLNEQTSIRTSSGNVSLAIQRTNMLRLVVTAHELGLPVGTQIVLGHAITAAQCGSAVMPAMDFGDPLGFKS